MRYKINAFYTQTIRLGFEQNVFYSQTVQKGKIAQMWSILSIARFLTGKFSYVEYTIPKGNRDIIGRFDKRFI